VATREIVGRMTGELLDRYRRMAAAYEALTLNPTAFTKEESISICYKRLLLMDEVVRRFEVDLTANWAIQPPTGVVEVEV